MGMGIGMQKLERMYRQTGGEVTGPHGSAETYASRVCNLLQFSTDKHP